MKSLTAFLAGLFLALAAPIAFAEPSPPTAIICWPNAAPAEKLAAKEIRRYIYLRTGKLLPIAEKPNPAGAAIIVTTKDRLPNAAADANPDAAKFLANVNRLAPQQYVLKTFDGGDQSALLVVGGDPIGTLYGAYRLAEHFGARFYLHGDVLPDQKVALSLPVLDEIGKPLFDLRGIQPFHDFPEGPDWWNRDTYKAYLGQLPKLRMNFIGLHCYPEGGVGPEPLVWIGPPNDIAPDGKVKASYPSQHYSTFNTVGAWGSQSTKTSDYVFGAADLFDRDDYGAEYMQAVPPWRLAPQNPAGNISPDQSNQTFDRMGQFLADVLGYARQHGIKSAIGTEVPLTIPTPVKQRLQAAGKNPADPAVVQEIYEGMFQRIAKTHPLDYYWLWTDENWTWSPVTQPQIDAVMANFQAAVAAAKKINAPFGIGTCGWVLGPPQNPPLFDKSLPKQVAMACISRQVGNCPIEPGFTQIADRPKWAIPWFEDDPGLTMPQLWAGRMRRDAADALDYRCTGLMGLLWRTRILAPNIAALAQAAWDQSGWNKDAATPNHDVKIPEGVEEGLLASFPNTRFAHADHDAVYQAVRYGMRAYHIDVPNGTYNVTLKLCEPAHTEKGKRVFGAKVQGRTLFEHLDIFAAVGKDTALDKTAENVKVTDGRLKIEFLPEVEYPCIAGIVIQGRAAASNQLPARDFTRKINCGGPIFQDFQADLSPTGPTAKPRFLPVADFYADWALTEFGPKAAAPAAALFTKLDGHLPRPADWVTGPGSIRPDDHPWDQVEKEYAFVNELEALRPLVEGPSCLERFNYWLDNFRYLRAIAKVRCAWGQLNAAIERAKAEKNPEAQKRLAREQLLPLRKQLVAAFAEMQAYLLATVSTPGELGNVCNWQQQVLPVVLTATGAEIAKLLGAPLPADAMPSKQYAGPARVFVREVRTAITAGETLKLTVVILGMSPKAADLYWRPLGTGVFAKVPLTHVARGVYTVTLPAAAVKADFEYYIQATAGQQTLQFPPAGATMPQTVVVE